MSGGSSGAFSAISAANTGNATNVAAAAITITHFLRAPLPLSRLLAHLRPASVRTSWRLQARNQGSDIYRSQDRCDLDVARTQRILPALGILGTYNQKKNSKKRPVPFATPP